MKTEAQQSAELTARTSGLTAPRLVVQVGKAATVDASTNTFTSAAHGFTNGMEVCVGATSLPGGLSAALIYYIVNAATDTFQLSATSGGAAIDITSAGSGVAVGALDPADPATWDEAADVATTNRVSLAGLFNTVTLDDAGNKQTRTWPTVEQQITLASGATVVRLGIADGTGAISSAGKSMSDAAFSVVVPAGGKLIIPADSQTSSEQ